MAWFMLIPITPFSHDVLLDANSGGSEDKRIRPGVQCPNGPQFNMAVLFTLEHRCTQNVRDRIRAKETEDLHTHKFHFGMIQELHLDVVICS